MSYAAEYVNLLNRLSESRQRRLMDVANLTGQAQMANSQVWGQLPGQLVNIASKSFDQYQGMKEQEMARKRQEAGIRTQGEQARIAGVRAAETERHNREIEDRVRSVSSSAISIGCQSNEPQFSLRSPS